MNETKSEDLEANNIKNNKTTLYYISGTGKSFILQMCSFQINS